MQEDYPYINCLYSYFPFYYNLKTNHSKKRVLKMCIRDRIEYAIKANQVQADKFGIQIEVEYPEEKMPKLFVDSEKVASVSYTHLHITRNDHHDRHGHPTLIHEF